MKNVESICEANVETKMHLSEIKGQVIREHLQMIINQILLLELNEFIGYDPHDTRGYNSGDSRNGFYTRKLKTPYGQIKVRIPRDRNGEFHQKMIAPYTRILDMWSRIVLLLYAKENSLEDIVNLLKEMYSDAYDSKTIHRMAVKLQSLIHEFHLKDLELATRSICVMSIPMQTQIESLSDCSIYLLSVINAQGIGEIVDVRKCFHTSPETVADMLKTLRARGVIALDEFYTDIPEVTESIIESVYPGILYNQVSA